MARSVTKLLFWVPRTLGILFALFLSIFALDVFSMGYGIWETVVGLFMHLIPTWMVLLALGIAWRWEWLGAVLFPVLGTVYIAIAWGKFDGLTYLIIAGPCFLVGALFLLDRLHHRRQLHGPCSE